MTATLPNPTDEAPAPSTRVYFSKALLTSKIMVGDKVPRYPDWEPLDGNQGVISLDSVADAEMISGLNKCVSDQMGGVLKISSEEYETLKKKPALEGIRAQVMAKRTAQSGGQTGVQATRTQAKHSSKSCGTC